MTLEDKFPKTIFVKQYIDKYGLDKGFTRELGVIFGELLEAQDSFSKKDYEHSMEELVDVLHATFSALYMVPGYSAEKVEKIIKQIHEKNEKRDYYE